MASHSLDVLRLIRPGVPTALAARADAWVDGTVPAPPEQSASALLLRPGAGGRVETFLLHRHARMAFAASMVVFPGGRVDPADRLDPEVDPLRACAVRETEEETGVRLAADDLLDWAHWTTPEFEPRRYDTRFYVAVLPDGQAASDVSGETDRAGWDRPAAAIAAAEAGDIALMPPTLSILTELAEAGTVDAVLALATDRVVEPVLPRLVRTPDGWQFRYPVREVGS